VEENNSKKTEDKSRSIEEVMRERQRIDRMLHEKFRRRLAILFSDVCGFTKYMDTRGDVSGRAWIQQHHDIVLPLIEGHEGKILDIMGDGVMASFPDTMSAVKASVAIQKGLEAYNSRTESADQIHVKIGVNVGELLTDGDQVAGDVVNVASRIQNQAGADEILISKPAYEDVSGCEDILCRLHGTVQVKGKAAPLELYRVVWREDDIVSDIAPVVRTHEAMVEREAKKPLKVLRLEVARERDRLKIGVHEHMAGEEITLRHYEEMPVSMDWIETRCREIVENLNRANRQGRLTPEVLIKLREVGQFFYDEFFTARVKRKFKETTAEYLSLNLDDHLVHIPWELLNDGHQFLCQRFNMGRLVRTRQTIIGSRSRTLARPLRMMILADPQGDLRAAYEEGIQIRDHMDRHKQLVNVSIRSGDITPEFIREKIRNFDLVHFAGHADYNPDNPEESGWRLTRGSLSAQDIIKMAGTAAMPALIFSNACQSARTEKWSLTGDFHSEIFGLANGFLLAGVKHYVGTFWEILDEPSSRFALEFYNRLLTGSTTGEAVRLSRQALIKAYGEETIVWASYLLYGDPTSSYLEHIKLAEAPADSEVQRVSIADKGIRAREEVIDFAEEEAPKKWKSWWAVATGIFLLAAMLVWGYPYLSQKQIAKQERAVLAYYHQGNFQEALKGCDTLEEKSPNSSLADIVRGNIYLRQGKLDAAEGAYQKALRAAEATELQKGEALVGLGRIASLRKQPEEALKFYQMATEVAPHSRSAYLSRALVLEDGGRYDEALDLLVKARKQAPEDHLLAALTKETRNKVILARDEEKQQRIDQMVKELLESMKSPPRALPSDGWTSLPLTMWMMEFQTQGYSLQEGEERLLVSGMADHVLQQSRIQLVERALLDKLLEELKFGTSEMIDRGTALSLGRILAARLILSGQIVYSEAQTQVSMRLIETETGRISAAVNESFGSAVPPSVMSDKLSKNLLEKLDKLYPLRCKIVEVKDKEVKLNIGAKVGARLGQQFKLVDEDLILEVIAMDPETCLARVTKGEGVLQKGLRVEEL
jgi:class 3 adenylate cyclase/CHAT domain-containing protein/tetratricopeptide (TPR) repeat protein